MDEDKAVIDGLAKALVASDSSRYKEDHSQMIARGVYNVLTEELRVDAVPIGKKLGEAKLIDDLGFDVHLDYDELAAQLWEKLDVQLPKTEIERLKNDTEASVMTLLKLYYRLSYER